MNNNTELISRYLLNEMDAEEKMAFERQLANDKGLQQELAIQQQIIKAAETAGLKNEFAKAIQKKIFNQRLLQWGIPALIITAAFTIYAVKTNLFSGHADKKKAKTESAEHFVINNTADTIIETRDGVVFGIPANAFGDVQNVELEIKTALDPYSIMRQGFSTMSNGSLLQTAGMFYINGYENGRPLELKKNIDVSVPANEINPDMQLFRGEQDSSGNINWVNPGPVAKQLRTYDITTLDFYPPDYIPTLKALGKEHTNKKYTDSLYYSFSGYPYASNGEAIFMSRCASCHSMGRNFVGPDLTGVLDRWGGNREHLKLFIKNWPEAVKAGYPEAEKAIKYSPTAMQIFNGLTDIQLDDLITYLSQWKLPVYEERRERMADTAIFIKRDSLSRYDSSRKYTDQLASMHYEIDPARIGAIWNSKFNNTILATKEFEERLRYMHGLCTAEYLNAYLEGLSYPIYKIDQLCADNSTGQIRKKFLEFAARKDGSVMIKEGMQAKLSEYFQTKYKAYQQATAETWAKYENELTRLNAIADEKQREQEVRDFKRDSSNYGKEFCANLSEAYRQVGRKYKCNDTIPPSAPANNYYNITIPATGWYNIDVFVKQVTNDRQSGTFIDSATGKKVTLTYNDVSIGIENLSGYDKVFVYLLPDGLSSYQRIEQKGDFFMDGLNSLFKYDAVAIGYKGAEAFFYGKTGLQGGQYSFSLSPINDSELKEALKKYSIQNADMQTEFEYRLFEQQEAMRQVQVRKDWEFRRQIVESIFNCGIEGGPMVITKLSPK